jgi:hypothetical protein
MMGKKVVNYSNNAQVGFNHFELNIENLSSGMYVYMLRDAAGNIKSSDKVLVSK